MFTNSPDEHFVIGAVTDGGYVAAGFSGHGYKFASVIGEVLADLATAGATDHDIAMFGPGRFD
jgi:sarcosine oxidase